jgi:DNA ligase 1
MHIPNFKPMLAATVPIDEIRLPVIATPKIDGIRCCTITGVAGPESLSVPVTRSLKDIPNRYAFKMLSSLPPGLDGELVVMNRDLLAPPKIGTFQQTSSAIMSHAGIPDFKFMVFDWVANAECYTQKYVSRIERLNEQDRLPGFVSIVVHKTIYTHEELINYIAWCEEQGYEGACVRPLNSPYKFGRATPKQQWLVKIKKFVDAEAEIYGFEELYSNQNAAEVSALGYQERSTKKEGMIPMDTLGALIVKDLETGVIFNIGTGFTAQQRIEIWADLDGWRGAIVKYKHQPFGMKDKPRIPVFLGRRSMEDM